MSAQNQSHEEDTWELFQSQFLLLLHLPYSVNVFCPFSLLDMTHSQSPTGLLSPFLLTPHSIVLFTLALEEFFQNITMIILLSCLMYANAFEKLLENNLNSRMNYKDF